MKSDYFVADQTTTVIQCFNLASRKGGGFFSLSLLPLSIMEDFLKINLPLQKFAPVSRGIFISLSERPNY